MCTLRNATPAPLRDSPYSEAVNSKYRYRIVLPEELFFPLRSQIRRNVGIESFHWEIKGWFRKRVVLANVPPFRFSFRGNIRRNHPFGNHPFVNTKKGHWEIKGRFPKGWFWRTYPRSGFRSGGTSAKTTLLETTLLRTPDLSLQIQISLTSNEFPLQIQTSGSEQMISVTTLTLQSLLFCQKSEVFKKKARKPRLKARKTPKTQGFHWKTSSPFWKPSFFFAKKARV